jgi:hypothetical protein
MKAESIANDPNRQEERTKQDKRHPIAWGNFLEDVDRNNREETVEDEVESEPSYP